jgi:predicted dehydrogenase
MSHRTRRAFLYGATSGTLMAAKSASKPLKPSVPARSASRILGANDRIHTGHIGVGGMGTAHLRAFLQQSEKDKDIQVVAVCDVYKLRRERAQKAARLDAKDAYNDYRELLARPDIDAVVIATPDHWHGQMALDALTAGKDVYLQKPMTYTIEEARAVAEAALKYGRILQVGSQGVSDPRNTIARKIVESGEIGELLWATATASRNSVIGEWNYRIEKEATPETVDWNRWLGSAPKRPFSPERYFRWRKYWDYSGGIATDLFYHSLGPVLFAMGPQFPVAVTGSGGIYVQKDRDVPDTYCSIIEYPNFFINLSGSMCNAAGVKYFPRVIYGHKGTLTYEGNNVVVYPEILEGPRGRPARTAARPPKVYEAPPVENAHRLHTDNFFQCMRTRKQPNLHAMLGYQIMVAIKLGVDSYREGKVKFFDPKTQRVTERPLVRPSYEGDGKNYDERTTD